MLLAALAFSLLVLTVAFGRKIAEYDTIISPVSMFGLSIAYYLFSIPLEISVTGRRLIQVSDRHIYINTNTGYEIVSYGLVAFLSFSLAYVFVLDKSRRFSPAVAFQSMQPDLRWVLLVATIGFSAMVIILFPSDLFAASTYAGNVSVSYANPVFAILRTFAVLSYGLFIFCSSLHGGWGPARTVAAAAPIAAYGLYFSDKDPFLIGALSAAGALLAKPGTSTSTPRLALGLVVAVPFLGVAVAAFSGYRGQSRDVLAYARQVGFFSSADPAGPMYSLSVASNEGVHDRFAGLAHILESFTLWIPRSLWPSRPLDLSEEFARTHMSGWRPGMGYGYSLVAEGISLAGWAGVVVVFALLGVLIGLVRNWLLRPGPGGSRRQLGYATSFVGMGAVSFLSLRGPLSGSISLIVHTLAFYSIISAALWVTRRRRP
ncbi:MULTISPECIES: hypothetical protein [unclassified Nocardioides]|uniref:hypothetical protein n=1 Tax=unclassified Nocardioides TaxID=2615069 RepID=UPI0000570B21|nr:MULTISPECIES: hypothetical protein [unclassified Nocardioides]ABL83711.1 hypothetical protein Noca_4214 [Nocardioides sp. JS614]